MSNALTKGPADNLVAGEASPWRSGGQRSTEWVDRWIRGNRELLGGTLGASIKRFFLLIILAAMTNVLFAGAAWALILDSLPVLYHTMTQQTEDCLTERAEPIAIASLRLPSNSYEYGQIPNEITVSIRGFMRDVSASRPARYRRVYGLGLLAMFFAGAVGGHGTMLIVYILFLMVYVSMVASRRMYRVLNHDLPLQLGNPSAIIVRPGSMKSMSGSSALFIVASGAVALMSLGTPIFFLVMAALLAFSPNKLAYLSVRHVERYRRRHS